MRHSDRGKRCTVPEKARDKKVEEVEASELVVYREKSANRIHARVYSFDSTTAEVRRRIKNLETMLA
jgi:hypothetical protein